MRVAGRNLRGPCRCDNQSNLQFCPSHNFLRRQIHTSSACDRFQDIAAHFGRDRTASCQNYVKHVLTTLSGPLQTRITQIFTASRHDTFGLRTRSDCRSGVTASTYRSRPTARARNGRRTACATAARTSGRARNIGTCTACCIWFCHRKQGRTGASVPPAGYFRVNDRTTRTERDTRSHRKVSRNQQAGQRPARRNIGWHLMPMY